MLRILCTVCIGVIVFCATNTHAQFTGQFVLGGNSSSNVAGIDTAGGDRAFTPEITLQDKVPISHLIHLEFEASYNPNIYTTTPNNSYTKFDLSAMGNFYLSENTAKKELPILPPAPHPTILHDTPAKPPPVATQPIPSSPPAKDSAALAAESLEQLADRLDALDIDTTGISDDEDSIDAANDLKDSLSESMLAVSEVLRAQPYSESIQQVLTEELTADLKLLSQIPFPKNRKDSIDRVISRTNDGLSRSIAKKDLLAMPTSPLDTAKKPLPAAIATIVKLPETQTDANDAPDITLVNALTDYTEFSTSDLVLREDALPRSSLTLATLLSVPVQYEQQSNQPVYKQYSYNQISFAPRLSIYPSDKAGLGLLYTYQNNTYPDDTLFTFSENRFRADGRFEIGSLLLVGAQIGLNLGNYLHPLDSTLRGPKGKILFQYTEPSNYSQTQFGLLGSFIVSERTHLGLGTVLTRSSELHPYLLDNSLGRSKTSGQATDDPFSYELSKVFTFITTRVFWDINSAIDLAFETRDYGKGVLRKNVGAVVPNRTDKGTLLTIDITKDFYIEDRIFSIFDVITPDLNFQYSKYNSTIKLYTYNDFTSSLSVAFGF
ncbi:MAG TPA: hypothetical protein VEW28_08665 [Candidatus Kapabacteria bacterium]|nr:hypothetical protein [Candidatus Kapabacteria bacterium]